MLENVTSQGRAEDILLFHRYAYYVTGEPLISDSEYDELEKEVRDRWSVSAADTVGSQNVGNYPVYIREGRRPNAEERRLRDEAISARWMGAL